MRHGTRRAIGLVALIFMLGGLAGCTSSHLANSEQALVLKDYRTAIAESKLCIEEWKDDGDFGTHCSFMLGKAYFERGQYREAATYLKQAIDIYGKNKAPLPWISTFRPAWRFWLGRSYFELGEYREAASSFNQAAAIAVQDPSSISQDPDWQKSYLPWMPSKDVCYFWLGNTYMRAGQPELASGAFRKAIELDPDFGRHYAGLASSEALLGRYEEALAAAKRAIELSQDGSGYAARAAVYEAKGDHREAAVNLRKAIELEPEKATFHARLGSSLAETGNFEGALAAYGRAVELSPDDVTFVYGRALAQMRKGLYADAIGTLDGAVARLTRKAGLWLDEEGGYPVVLRETGDEAGVAEGPARKAGFMAGDRIIRINGASTKGWDSKKAAREFSGGEDGSVVAVTVERRSTGKPVELRLVRESFLPKKAARLLGLRSLAHRENGLAEKAAADAARAYSLNPDDNDARVALGAVYLDEGRYDDAVKTLSRAPKEDPLAKILLATAYAKASKVDDAVSVLGGIPEEYLSGGSALREAAVKAMYFSFRPHASAIRGRARELEASGSYREAIGEYARALKLSDEKAGAEIMGRIAAIIKARPEAGELSEDARRHALRAEVFTKEGKFAEAVREYGEAIRLAPHYPALYKASALNHAELGQYRQAIKNIRTYLALSPDAPDARSARDEIYKWELLMERGGK